MQAEEPPVAIAAEEPAQPGTVQETAAGVPAVNKSTVTVEAQITAVNLKVDKINTSLMAIDGQLEQLKRGKVPENMEDMFSFQMRRLRREEDPYVAAVEALIADLREKRKELCEDKKQLREDKKQLHEDQKQQQEKERQQYEREKQERAIRLLEMQSRVGNEVKAGMGKLVRGG
jgi:chromosome segregation ATPase